LIIAGGQARNGTPPNPQKKKNPQKKVMLTGTVGSRRSVAFHAPSSD
jgi:hypothetical protein